ncbi:TetR/AcrR family transcriptional regulator [Shewanella sp. Isolate7]|uniref:TetR/AcrR family transcriptional regulator n=1 Tax=Shewanella sp. Isolate7 TaxID=2908528 RepID=UPI001EFEC47C|nr:TetR/AcrR family transcriptional regulator [Shewanella sp. Isolate7]MCG9722085.1 TetR/AcrR family transcriptional regulator [Shewanella sp. Isolate7]
MTAGSKRTKKQAILDTALQLFVSQGFHGTSTATIAREAGVATGTLFHHFPSKEQLLEQLFLSVKQEFADAIQSAVNKRGDLKQDAEQLWIAALSWAIDNPMKQAFFQLYSMSPTVEQSVRDQAMHSILGFIGALIRQGQAQGLLADFPQDLMLDNCHGQYLAATRYFADHPERWQQEHERSASFALFWNAMAVR